jgi:hypothetical protein
MNIPTAKQVLLQKGYTLTPNQYNRWFVKTPEGKIVNPNPKGISTPSLIALAKFVQKNS